MITPLYFPYTPLLPTFLHKYNWWTAAAVLALALAMPGYTTSDRLGGALAAVGLAFCLLCWGALDARLVWALGAEQVRANAVTGAYASYLRHPGGHVRKHDVASILKK